MLNFKFIEHLIVLLIVILFIKKAAENIFWYIFELRLIKKHGLFYHFEDKNVKAD